jgi:hypothetical protein
MSNGSGSIMLNNILCSLDKSGLFSKLQDEDTRKLLLIVNEHAKEYDCNSGTVLSGFFERYKICHQCQGELVQKEYTKHPICHTCYMDDKDFWDEE